MNRKEAVIGVSVGGLVLCALAAWIRSMLQPFDAPTMALCLLGASGFAGLLVWVLVRKDLASTREISLAATDLNGAPTAYGEFAIFDGTLTWTSLSVTFKWDDTADNETGYRVETSDDDGTTWTTAATLPAGSTSYPDTIPRGVNRGYRVIAVNSFGESAPMESWHEAPALFACTGDDATITTVVVNLWDPTTLAFHGTTTLTKQGNYFAPFEFFLAAAHVEHDAGADRAEADHGRAGRCYHPPLAAQLLHRRAGRAPRAERRHACNEDFGQAHAARRRCARYTGGRYSLSDDRRRSG